MAARYPGVEVTWVVMSACGERADEARRSANALLKELPGENRSA